MARSPSCRPVRGTRLAWLVAAALVLAPALADVWPALGRGPMLYTGEAAPAAAHHHPTSDATDDAHAGHAEHAGATADADGGAAQGEHAGHGRHCALCELVSLAWAPTLGFASGADVPPAVHGAVAQGETPTRSLVAWARAPARAPPFFS